MKVLMVSEGYPTKKYPMNGIHEMIYAKSLKSQGINVKLACLDRRSIRRKRKFGFTKIIIDGIEIYNYSIPLGNVPNRLINFSSKIYFSKILKKLKKEGFIPDIIHSHWYEVSNGVVQNKKDIPILITEHSSVMDSKIIPKSIFKTAKYAYENADMVHIANKYFLKELNDKFNANFSLFPILSETKKFKYKKIYKEKEYFDIVTVGNLKRSKGHRDSINAFEKAFKDKKARLFIIGDGYDKKYLENMIKEKSLKNKVFLEGFKNLEYISKKYLESDIFLLSSHKETFGKVVIEALFSGLPVVVTNCRGPEQFINKDNGLIAKTKDINDISNSLLEMYENIDLYDREKISKEIEKKYSLDLLTKKLIDEYKQIIYSKKRT